MLPAIIIAACNSVDPSVAERSVATEQRELRVDYDGCKYIIEHAELECIYEPESTLRVWVEHADPSETKVWADYKPDSTCHVWTEHTDLSASKVPVDDRRIDASEHYTIPEQTGHGRRIRLGKAEVRGLTVQVPGKAPWHLHMRSTGALTEAEQRTITELEQRFDRIKKQLPELGDMTPGEVTEFFAQADSIIEGALVAGLRRSAAACTVVTIYAALYLDDLQDAERRLERLRAHVGDVSAAKARLAIWEGHVRWKQDRLLHAALSYRAGALHAVRTEQIGLQRDVLGWYAEVSAQLGYYDAADHWAREGVALAREHGKSASIAKMSGLAARTSLALREVGRPHQDPRPLLQEVIRHSGSRAPAWAYLALAHLALLDGAPSKIREYVEAASERRLYVDDRVRAIDLGLRAMLQSETPEELLLARLDELEQAADRAGSTQMRWQAKVRRGAVLEHLGRADAALEAYEQSEVILDRLLPLSVLGVTGDLVATQRHEGTDGLVKLHLARGNADDALCAVRRARRRLSSLALTPRTRSELGESFERQLDEHLRRKSELAEALEQERKMLPDDQLRRREQDAAARQQELEQEALRLLATKALEQETFECGPPLEDRQLLLALYPLGGELIAIASIDGKTTSHQLPEVDGTTLLEPLDDLLDIAESIRVISLGHAASVAVHALPWRGQMLGLQRPVVYGFELPHPSEKPKLSETTALVFADPQRGGTRTEQAEVAEALQIAGWTVESHVRGDVSPEAIRDLLSGVDYFYYAGHVSFGERGQSRLWPPYAGGPEAQPSHLALGKGSGGSERSRQALRASNLEVSDILLMERVPAHVALMGCNSGVYDARSALAGYSLAMAFLGAGSRSVVASTRNVEPTETTVLSRAFHAPRVIDIDDPGRRMMYALQQAREEGMPEDSIPYFRVLVP